jgi:3'-phosphoadenosine 5'-phosphosulfate sulfotransferase (PAPS reductase)/FAD synthetase
LEDARVTAPRLRVLSLGAGVQSTTLALMAAAGEIEAPDCAIFADTHWEPASVYTHLGWLEPLLPFPVHHVSAGDIRANIATRRNTTGGRYAAIPFFMLNQDGTKGMGRRQCTSEYKIEPINRKIRELLGKQPRQRIPADAVDLLIGISADEAQRAKPSRTAWTRKTFPLLDLGMRRSDCLAWLAKHQHPTPPKSACIGCPFTSDHRWMDRRRNQPAEWADAVEADRQLRTGHARGMRGVEFMHSQRVPLDEVDFSRIDPDRQPDLFGNECEGMCGV